MNFQPQQPSADSTIPARLRPLVRAIWLAIALFLLASFVFGVPLRQGELTQTCDRGACIVQVLTSAEAEALQDLGGSLAFYATLLVGSEIYLVLVFGLSALLIFWRRSDTWLGVLVSLSLLFFGLVFFSEEIRSLSRSIPALDMIAAPLTTAAIVFFLLPFFIFPDGRFVPRWTRFLVFVCSAILIADAILPFTDAQAASASMVAVVAGMSTAGVGLLAQIYRYRRVSDPVRRQQTKWVTFGFVSLFVAAIAWTLFVEVFPLNPGPTRLLFSLSAPVQSFLIGLFPISIAVSILRYRLWDIDLIIRKTLVYSSITVLLLLVYFGSVVLLQQAVHLFTDQESPVVIVLSTLLIAALFSPLRIRIQDAIDRRFYRRKYDAQRVLAAFAQTARDETDLDDLTANLAQVVEQAMQPEQVIVWLRQTRR